MSDIELRFLIDNLHARYAHAIDDDRLEEWPGFFVEQGIYRIVTAENLERGLPLPMMLAESRSMLRDRVNSLRRANIYEAQRYRHSLSATIIDRTDSVSVRATSNFIVVRIMHTGESSLFASGRYLDRISLKGDDGQPQFEERVVVLDSRAVDTLLAIPL